MYARMIMQRPIMQYLCALLLLLVTFIEAKPAYSYAEKVERGESPVEDHSVHLEAVANAYRQTDHIYNNYPNADTLQKQSAVTEYKGIEYAVKEVEHPDSAIQTFYENKHRDYNNNAGRAPIIDRIKESDKFGNTGDQFLPLTRGIVNGFEFIANIINKSISGLQNAGTQTIKLTNEQLDQVGAKIVGL